MLNLLMMFLLSGTAVKHRAQGLILGCNYHCKQVRCFFLPEADADRWREQDWAPIVLTVQRQSYVS
jgi:hypothetical protein